MYTHILFDLDGTITDPGLGITNSVMYSLRTYGIEITDRESLYPFIGPPLDESFMRYFGFRKEDCPEAIRRYREYFSDRGLFENEIYPGVSKMLSELKKAGKKIILATSKPEVFAERILEHFDLREYFDLVAGSTLDGSRIKKADVIKDALFRLGITSGPSLLMVGDREHDIIGARTVGIDSVGVLYGYGSREELETAGAGYLAASPEEVTKIALDI